MFAVEKVLLGADPAPSQRSRRRDSEAEEKTDGGAYKACNSASDKGLTRVRESSKKDESQKWADSRYRNTLLAVFCSESGEIQR